MWPHTHQKSPSLHLHAVELGRQDLASSSHLAQEIDTHLLLWSICQGESIVPASCYNCELSSGLKQARGPVGDRKDVVVLLPTVASNFIASTSENWPRSLVTPWLPGYLIDGFSDTQATL